MRVSVRSAMVAVLGSAMFGSVLWAQLPTTTVVTVEAKKGVEASVRASDVTVEVDGKKQPLTNLVPLMPAQTQVAILLDDSLRTSIGRQLDDLSAFINGLKPGVEVMVGYMQNGRVVGGAFTADHAAAAKALRLPLSVPGVAASPYFSLGEMAKSWPRETEAYGAAPAQRAQQKARFVLMITNGVDPYNGSVSPLNQNSPYVQQATTEAQRAGVTVYSIYATNVGVRGGLASFSGQSYLQQVADATGGALLYTLRGNPPSYAPYLQNFQTAMDNSELATFSAPEKKDLVQVRFKTDVKGIKLRATQALRAGSGEQPVAE